MIKDFLGTPVGLGDRVIFPYQPWDGCDWELRVGKVVEISVKDIKVSYEICEYSYNTNTKSHDIPHVRGTTKRVKHFVVVG